MRRSHSHRPIRGRSIDGCSRRRFAPAIALVLALICSSVETVSSQAQSADPEAIEAIVENYLARHPEQIERIVKDYLVKHPEVIQASIAQLLLRRAAVNSKRTAASAGMATDKAAVIRSNAPALFRSPHDVMLGNPEGDVTMVEFFDYNCGYCKRALADMLGLLRADPKLRIVLKELPILGLESSEAAAVAIGVRMQDPSGVKYLAFHQKLLASQERADKARAIEVARAIGLDIPRLEQDMASDEVRATLEENARLARELGINGTPGYVIGEAVVLGAVGMATLKDKVEAQRR
jgi:protein-disulfide isomerase